jgi:hypothetical protein
VPGEVPPGWRVIERAGNEIDARLIAGHLQDAGIKVVLEKDNSGYGDYLYGGSNPNAPVSLLVPETQWDAATAVLDEVSVDLTAPVVSIETPDEGDDPAEGDDPSAGDEPLIEDDDGRNADRFYVGDPMTEEQVLAAPSRSGLRWLVIILVVLIVAIAAIESGFFSDLIGV